MDTITTDSGKKLKIEEGWVIDQYVYEEKSTKSHYVETDSKAEKLYVKRVWVLVEKTDET